MVACDSISSAAARMVVVASSVASMTASSSPAARRMPPPSSSERRSVAISRLVDAIAPFIEFEFGLEPVQLRDLAPVGLDHLPGAALRRLEAAPQVLDGAEDFADPAVAAPRDEDAAVRRREALLDTIAFSNMAHEMRAPFWRRLHLPGKSLPDAKQS